MNIFLSFIIISPMVVVPDLGFAAVERDAGDYIGLSPEPTKYVGASNSYGSEIGQLFLFQDRLGRAMLNTGKVNSSLVPTTYLRKAR